MQRSGRALMAQSVNHQTLIPWSTEACRNEIWKPPVWRTANLKQNAALASARAEAHAKVISAKASSLEANLGLSLA